MPSKLTQKQVLDLLKTAAYISISASIDYLISETTGSQFGTLTPVINIVLVLLRKIFSKSTTM